MRHYEKVNPDGKAEWLTDRRKAIELVPGGSRRSRGAASHYIWITRRNS